MLSIETLKTLEFSSEASFEVMVVLGAGTGRLGAELGEHLRAEKVFAIDLNPYLMRLGQDCLIKGKTLRLPEFASVPRSLEHVSKAWNLSYSGRVPEGFSFVAADGLAPPIQPESVDLVFTPWYIDILGKPLPEVVKSIHQILKPGGLWLNFGVLSFLELPFAQRLTADEIFASFDQFGFSLEQQRTDRLPYLNSPLNCQSRTENVYTWVAKKSHDFDDNCLDRSESKPPAWLGDITQPIETHKFFDNFRFKQKLFFDVVEKVDGQSSIKDISQFLVEAYGLPEDTAVATTARFFEKLWRERNQAF